MADAPVRLEPVGAAWARRYREWAPRIADALVDAFDGGVLLDLEHVGSTAVPGLPAKPTLDVMARVHPWPLPEERASALVALGFVDQGEHGLPGRRSFTQGGHDVHLHVVGLEFDHWSRHLALRDLLRTDAGARSRYARAKRAVLATAAADPGLHARAAYQEAKATVLTALEREALVRRVGDRGFGPLAQVRSWLAGAPPRWVVAGADGVAAYRRRAVREPPPDGVHQAHGRRGELWVDVVLEPWTDAGWRYRREPEVELPLALAVRRVAAAGVEVPVLAPAVVLLFKATTGGRRLPRPKDDADLQRVRALLTPEEGAWLRAALAATVPDHPWCAPDGPLA